MSGRTNFAGLSLRDFEYVQTVAEHKSFGQAAVVCGISQPAISQQVRKLEERLGFKIFERSRGGFAITPQGKKVLAQIEVILHEARLLLQQSVNLMDPLESELRLGVIPTLGPYLMPLILRNIRTTFPKLKLHLVELPTTDLEASLLTQKLDLLLLATKPESPKISGSSIFDEPFYYACPEDYGLQNNAPVQWDKIDQDELLFPSSEHCMRDQTLGFCDLNDNPDRRVGTSLEMLRQMVATGEGSTLLPQLAVSGEDRTGGLISIHPIAEKDLSRTIRLCWRKTDERGKKFNAFADYLKGLELLGRKH